MEDSEKDLVGEGKKSKVHKKQRVDKNTVSKNHQSSEIIVVECQKSGVKTVLRQRSYVRISLTKKMNFVNVSRHTRRPYTDLTDLGDWDPRKGPYKEKVKTEWMGSEWGRVGTYGEPGLGSGRKG